MMEDYRKNLLIDRDNLDEEVIKQPTLFDHYAQALLPLNKERDNLKLGNEQLSDQTGYSIQYLSRKFHLYFFESQPILPSIDQSNISEAFLKPFTNSSILITVFWLLFIILTLKYKYVSYLNVSVFTFLK